MRLTGVGGGYAEVIATPSLKTLGHLATMLELGQSPPDSSERTIQINIRLTPEEKVRIATESAQRGFRGI